MGIDIYLTSVFGKMRNTLRRFYDIWHSLVISSDKPIVVTFTGGMGAQIISAAIYFYYRNEGREIYADLSYFDQPERVATEGRKGDVSHWGWQLQFFGLFPESFTRLQTIPRRKYHLIHDGLEKLTLGVKALGTKSIQNYFVEDRIGEVILLPELSSNYVCVHVRRGDYTNVASHIINDTTFIALAGRVAGLLNEAVIVSDSAIDDNFRQAICNAYKKAIFLDNVDAITAHRIMRNATVLVCSNSQFSLVAALLNRRALVVLPKRWFGADNQKLEVPISELCDFQILSS